MTDTVDNKNYFSRTRNPFTQIPNLLIESPEISSKAKAIYCYLYSKKDGWTFYNQDILNHMKEKKDTLRSVLKELEKFGWISRARMKNDQGQYTGTHITIHYEPGGIKPDVDKPGVETSPHSNTKTTNTELKKENNKRKKSPKITIEEWELIHGRLTSEKIAAWVAENNLIPERINSEIEPFREKVSQAGTEYANFEAAFKNWIREGYFKRHFTWYQQPSLLPQKQIRVAASVETSPNNL